ncbi:MAG: septum site-determining protein MinC [Christensenellales bacterium]
MAVTIKGKSGGVLQVAIKSSASYNNIKLAISEKMSRHRHFFEGADPKVVVSGKSFSVAQKNELLRLFKMDYGITNVVFDDEMEQRFEEAKKAEHKDMPPNDARRITLVSDCFAAKSVFVAHTLRGGQRIECEGDVVVLGDVNDGAEIIAGGSIAVMGTLRGLAHAGATGRDDVVVAANCLVPKQLRISGRIAVFPAEQKGEVPEIAEYKKESIVIRPLKPQKRT